MCPNIKCYKALIEIEDFIVEKEKKFIWLKNLGFSVEGDSVRKYKWSTSSTEVIIFEVITSCRKEMLYKKTSEQCSKFENKSHIQRKISKYKSLAKVRFGVS